MSRGAARAGWGQTVRCRRPTWVRPAGSDPRFVLTLVCVDMKQ